MNIIELINSQYIDGKFNRVDLVVRYMYIKEYVEKNNDFDATDIYLCMVEKRGCFGYKSETEWLLDFNVTSPLLFGRSWSHCNKNPWERTIFLPMYLL